MKLTFTILCLTFLSSCVFNRSVTSSADYLYNADFDSYRTYAVINNTDLTAGQNIAIAKGIHLQMSALGFESNVDQSSLHVYYQLYTDRFSYQSWQQPTLRHWIQNEPFQMVEGAEITRTIRKKTSGQTLRVVLFDPKIGKEVWRGTISRPSFVSAYDYQSAVQELLYQYMIYCQRPKAQSIAVLE